MIAFLLECIYEYFVDKALDSGTGRVKAALFGPLGERITRDLVRRSVNACSFLTPAQENLLDKSLSEDTSACLKFLQLALMDYSDSHPAFQAHLDEILSKGNLKNEYIPDIANEFHQKLRALAHVEIASEDTDFNQLLQRFQMARIEKTTSKTLEILTEKQPVTRRRAGPPRELTLPDFEVFGLNFELRELCEFLEPQNVSRRVAVVHGIGGVGKSTLIRTAALRHVDTFPDGQIMIPDMRESHCTFSVEDAQRWVIRSIDPTVNLSNCTPQRIHAHYITLTSSLNVLICLGSVSIDDSITNLIPPPPSKLIAESRGQVFAQDAVYIFVSPLERRTSINLLLKSERCAKSEADGIDELASLCGDLPLALVVAKGCIDRSSHALSHFLSLLRDERSRLKHLKIGDLNVEAVLGLSARELLKANHELALFWHKLTIFAGGFTLQFAAAIGDEDYVYDETPRVAEFLNELRLRNLILWDGEKYVWHSLLKSMALRLSDYWNENLGAFPVNYGDLQKQHASFFFSLINSPEEIENLFAGFIPNIPIKLITLRSCWQDHLQAFSWAKDNCGSDSTAATLANFYPRAAGENLDYLLNSDERIEWVKSGLEQAYHSGDKTGIANHLNSYGNMLFFRGDLRNAQAVYESALLLAEEIDEKIIICQAVGNLGLVQRSLGNLETARGFFERKRAVATEIGWKQGMAEALEYLSYVDVVLDGTPERALVCAKEALDIARDHSIHRTMGGVLVHIANIEYSRRNMELASTYLEEAREVVFLLDDPVHAVNFLVLQGRISRSNHDWPLTFKSTQDALDYMERSGYQRIEWQVLGLMASHCHGLSVALTIGHRSLGSLAEKPELQSLLNLEHVVEEQARFSRRAVESARSTGQEHALSEAIDELFELAQRTFETLLGAKQFELARVVITELQKHAQEPKEFNNLRTLYAAVTNVLTNSGQMMEARWWLEESATIEKQYGEENVYKDIMRILSICHAKLGESSAALREFQTCAFYYRKSLECARVANESIMLAIRCLDLGQVLAEELDRPEEAIPLLLEHMNIMLENGKRAAAAESAILMAGAAVQTSRFELAVAINVQIANILQAVISAPHPDELEWVAWSSSKRADAIEQIHTLCKQLVERYEKEGRADEATPWRQLGSEAAP